MPMRFVFSLMRLALAWILFLLAAPTTTARTLFGIPRSTSRFSDEATRTKPASSTSPSKNIEPTKGAAVREGRSARSDRCCRILAP